MKLIKLTKGKYAIVDDDMFDYLNQWKWYFDNRGYAVRKPTTGIIQMHRLVNSTQEGLCTDHINRNKLDNRKNNLRTVTKAKNQYNLPLFKTNKSGHKGVFFDKKRKRWLANISFKDKTIFLGRFKEIEEAILVRKNAERTYYV